VAALAEDFGRGGEPAVRAQLSRIPAEKLSPELRRLAQGPASPAQVGARRYLEESQGADGSKPKRP
jgi:hypothetical protein